MVITIRGLDRGIYHASAAAALISAMTAVVKSKKTLVMQFTGTEAPAIVDYLVGKHVKGNDYDAAFRLYSDDGMDGLLVRAESNELEKAHFDQTVMSILGEKENLFDVLKPTNKNDFYEMLSVDGLAKIVEGAKHIYDYIYIVLPERANIIDRIDPLADEKIIVVPQGPTAMQGAVKYDPDELTVLVTDYEAQSIYSAKQMAKIYDVKRVYVIPHSYSYRDAILSENLLDYVERNKKNMKEDDNFEFTDSLMKLLDKYITAAPDEPEEEAIEDLLPEMEELETMEIEEIEGMADEAIQEMTVSKGLFGRSKYLTADL